MIALLNSQRARSFFTQILQSARLLTIFALDAVFYRLFRFIVFLVSRLTPQKPHLSQQNHRSEMSIHAQLTCYKRLITKDFDVFSDTLTNESGIDY